MTAQNVDMNCAASYLCNYPCIGPSDYYYYFLFFTFVVVVIMIIIVRQQFV